MTAVLLSLKKANTKKLFRIIMIVVFETKDAK
jgi:hypothetical protein